MGEVERFGLANRPTTAYQIVLHASSPTEPILVRKDDGQVVVLMANAVVVVAALVILVLPAWNKI